MKRSRLAPLLVALFLVAACGSSSGPRSSREGTGAQSPLATSLLSPALSTPNAATPHGDQVGGGASIGYVSFREWVASWAGVALVDVVAVGPLRWTTPNGARPSEEVLHTAPAGHDNSPGIGRIITVRQARLFSGRWLGPGDTGQYFRPGGQISLDVDVSEIPLPELTPRQRAIAFVLPAEGDLGSGAPQRVQIAWLFPVDADGRIQTLDPREQITLDTIASYLP